ncbi:clumping factor A isoform X8 [Plutella xylostella]|uniref:clumping factor A isoform X8 n=1 Tax=Plutella xylostella TaxID=51655 RepID=UPI002032B445|nr:clumping factor A isoform X8 [Plutella xylostella]
MEKAKDGPTDVKLPYCTDSDKAKDGPTNVKLPYCTDSDKAKDGPTDVKLPYCTDSDKAQDGPTNVKLPYCTDSDKAKDGPTNVKLPYCTDSDKAKDGPTNVKLPYCTDSDKAKDGPTNVKLPYCTDSDKAQDGPTNVKLPYCTDSDKAQDGPTNVKLPYCTDSDKAKDGPTNVKLPYCTDSDKAQDGPTNVKLPYCTDSDKAKDGPTNVKLPYCTDSDKAQDGPTNVKLPYCTDSDKAQDGPTNVKLPYCTDSDKAKDSPSDAKLPDSDKDNNEVPTTSKPKIKPDKPAKTDAESKLPDGTEGAPESEGVGQEEDKDPDIDNNEVPTTSKPKIKPDKPAKPYKLPSCSEVDQAKTDAESKLPDGTEGAPESEGVGQEEDKDPDIDNNEVSTASKPKIKPDKPVEVFWRLGVVPYYLNPNTYDALVSRRVKSVMNYLESTTCVKFSELAGEPDEAISWLNFDNPDRARKCVYQPDVKYSGEILLVLGFDCLKWRQILQTILRGLGLRFEVSHPRRDDYVRIIWDNIQPEYRELFRIDHAGKDRPQYAMDYDPLSVLHFHDRAFSRNGQATIMPLVPELQIRPSEMLSQMDMAKIELIFHRECNRRSVGEIVDTCQTQE